MQVQVDGRDVLLTATEFQLLLHMARQPGRVFTRAQLLDAVHGVAVESYERAIDAHVKNIRRKIERDPRSPRHLQTVFGVGYRLVDGDRMRSGPPWGRGAWRPPAVVAGGRAGAVVRRAELAAPRAAHRAAHRLLRRTGAARASSARSSVSSGWCSAPSAWSARRRSTRRWRSPRWCSARVAVVVALLVLRRLAAPVGALIEGAHRIEAGDLSARVPVRGPSDLRSLARAMNDMSSRLEAEETRRRSVLADIAHELRTPLSIIRGQAEAITDGIYPADAEHMAPIVSATESLEMLVNDLGTLTLAGERRVAAPTRADRCRRARQRDARRLRRRGRGGGRAAHRAGRRRTFLRSTPTRAGCAEFWAISSATRWRTRVRAAASGSRELPPTARIRAHRA